jgi:hypothetical protein
VLVPPPQSRVQPINLRILSEGAGMNNRGIAVGPTTGSGRLFSSPKRPEQLWSAPSLIFRGQSGRGVKITLTSIYCHHTPTLQHALLASTGTTSPFNNIKCQHISCNSSLHNFRHLLATFSLFGTFCLTPATYRLLNGPYFICRILSDG